MELPSDVEALMAVPELIVLWCGMLILFVVHVASSDRRAPRNPAGPRPSIRKS